MLPVTVLKSKKVVFLEGDSITQEEALEIATQLLATWGQVHQHAKIVPLYEVDVKGWSDCPHYDDLKMGLEYEGWN